MMESNYANIRHKNPIKYSANCLCKLAQKNNHLFTTRLKNAILQKTIFFPLSNIIAKLTKCS